jgi:hypothetical protein
VRYIRSKLTYANVLATLALIVALSGGAYAAVSIPKNSITTSQIAPNAVKRADIAQGAVNSAKVANRSLRAVDFAPNQLPKGEKGEKGDPGAAGARGPSNGFVFRSTGDTLPADPAPTSKVIGSLALPAGRFVVQAKALLGSNTQGGFIDCVLTQAGTTIDQSQFYIPAGGGAGSPGDENAVLMGGIDLPGGGTVNLTCQRANSQTLGAFADDIRIVAVQVETLATSP